jgi:predicted HTH transcriptional regulator
MESVIYEKRQEYYDAIEAARDENNSAPFIEYTLSALYASALNQIAVQENSTGANDHVDVVLNSTENLVLAILRKEPSITAKKLAERISKTEKTAKRNIASLKEKGIIEREGSDKVGLWRIIDG